MSEPKTQQLPLLPLRDLIIFPHMMMPLFVGREKSINALEDAMSKQSDIVLAAQKDAKTNNPDEKDIYAVGTVGTIIQLLRLPDGTVKVLVEGKRRVRIKNFVSNEGFFIVNCETINEDVSNLTEASALVRSVKGTFDKDIVGVEQACTDNHDHRDDHDFQHAHDHRRGKKLAWLERTGEQIHEISRPNLLQKRNRHSLLSAKQHIPQNQRPQKERHHPRDLFLKFHEVDRNESPNDEIQKRPIENLHHTWQAAPIQIQMSHHQCINPMQLHRSLLFPLFGWTVNHSGWALGMVPTAAVERAHSDRARSGSKGTIPSAHPPTSPWPTSQTLLPNPPAQTAPQSLPPSPPPQFCLSGGK